MLFPAVLPIAQGDYRRVSLEAVDDRQLTVYAHFPAVQRYHEQEVDFGPLQGHDAQVAQVLCQHQPLQPLALIGVARDEPIHRRHPQELVLPHYRHCLRAQVGDRTRQHCTAAIVSVLNGVQLSVPTNNAHTPLDIEGAGHVKQSGDRRQVDLAQERGVDRVLRQDVQLPSFSSDHQQIDGVTFIAFLFQRAHARYQCGLVEGNFSQLRREFPPPVVRL